MGGFSGVLGTMAIQLVADVDEYLTAIADVADETDKAINAVDQKFQGLQNVGSQLTGLGASLTAAITLPIAGLTALSVQAAGDFDSMMRGLTAVAGSSAEAQTQLARLKEVAKLPGLGLEEAVQGSIRLQAVGTSAQEAERQMMAFGNALATVGKGKADLDGVIAQLVQMSSKTQVLSSDLRPIMERVPQAATIIKDAFGTIDTEVIQKMGVSTKDLINTMVTGLERLPPVTGGIKNAFENLGDSMNQALVKIGTLFIPLIEKLTPLIDSLVSGFGQLVEWFGNLPAPVQAAVGAVVALAAVLGPIVVTLGAAFVAVGSLSAALVPFGVTIGGLAGIIAPWIVAIVAVTAALTALGVWVYQDWEPIVATLTQAWSGIAEMWTAAWNAITGAVLGIWNSWAGTVNSFWTPVKTFFLGIWDAVAPYFVAAWDAIRGALTTVWNAILDTANKVWGAITGAFKTFLEWAAKIPGASKLMTLTEAWQGAKALNIEVEKTNVVLPKAAANMATLGTESQKAGDKIKPVAFHIAALEQKIKDEQSALLAGHKDFQKWADAHKDAESQIPKVTAVSDELNASITRIIGSMKNVPPAFLNAETQAQTSMQSAVDKVKNLEDAYKNLGITSTATLDEQARKATESYNTIRDNAATPISDIQRAWVAMEEANIAASKAAGDTISQDRLKALEDMKGALDQKLPEQKSKWQDFSNEVSTIITNFTQDIAKSLFDGDMSWGEKAKGMLKSLGEAVTSMFLQPFTDAIGKFIAGALTDLLGGKGLGGIFDSLKGIGSTIGGLFGKGGGAAGDVAGAVGGVGQAAGGAAGSVGSGASAAIGAGLSGVVGAVSGVVSAVTGVIGIFQSAHQETSLNAIEHNTRYSMMYLGERGDGGIMTASLKTLELIGYINGSMDDLRSKMDAYVEPMKNDVHSIMEKFFFAQTRLDEISSNTYWGLQATQDNATLLSQIRDIVAHPPAGNWTVTFTGDSIAKMVGDQIMAQLRLQGVNLTPGKA